MTLDLTKIQALAAKAVAEGADQTKATTGGGGDYVPPPEGPVALRFFGYIELGKQKGTFQNKPTIKEKVVLLFEARGKKYLTGENKDQPTIFKIEENFSLNEKAHYFKLFTRMNHDATAQHMTQLLGRGFRGEVVHDKWTGRDGKEQITAVLRNGAGYTVGPARMDVTDAEGEVTTVPMPVPDLVTPLKVFFWNDPDMDQWASLFIDGEYPERKDKDGKVTAPAKSKNVWQNKIRSADNFKASPLYALLANNGQPLDIPEPGEDPDEGRDVTADVQDTPAAAPAVPQGAAADDALAGVA